MNSGEIVNRIRILGRNDYRDRMPRFGINSAKAFGVPVPEIRKLAREIPKSAELAMELWATGIHEARIISTLIYPPSQLTWEHANAMIGGVTSWDICDHLTGNLIAGSQPELVLKLLQAWHSDEREFVKRGAYSLIASLDRSSWYQGTRVPYFLDMIKKGSNDSRNYVKKAVSWALREIGKSSAENRILALKTVGEIKELGTPTARWIASDSRRELESPRVLKRFS